MKVQSIRIENFRSIIDETIYFDDYTCLVGPNGVGKSTVLTALNLFFREFSDTKTDLRVLNEEDFHCKQVDEPVCITVTFTSLCEDAQIDFKDYVRQEKLIVSAKATYSDETKGAEVKQFGQRFGMKAFVKYFEADKDKHSVSDLKEIYANLRDQYPKLPVANTKEKMKNALHTYEAENESMCELIPSEDEFYGFSRGKNRLAKFIQWVYVPAVKDVTSEQIEENNSSLGKLLARTVRSKIDLDSKMNALRDNLQKQYQKLLDDNQNVLSDISKSLERKLTEWAHLDAKLSLHWKQDPNKSVRVDQPWAHIVAGENGFEGELSRFGHGFQRSYLLALLQELADIDSSNSPTLLLGFEEPELYQHPPQIRHFAKVLQELSENKSQIILCSHSPLFVTGKGFESVRMFRKVNSEVIISSISFDKLSEEVKKATGESLNKQKFTEAKLHQTLQSNISEMFFTPRLVLVEGKEDIAYLYSYLLLHELYNDFHKIGAHIVDVGGKCQLLNYSLIAMELGIPIYIVFDGDVSRNDGTSSRKQTAEANKNILNLFSCGDFDPMPDKPISNIGFTMWHTDIGSVVKEEIGSHIWNYVETEAVKEYGKSQKLKKNIHYIGYCLELAFESGTCSLSLKQVCQDIVNHEKYYEHTS